MVSGDTASTGAVEFHEGTLYAALCDGYGTLPACSLGTIDEVTGVITDQLVDLPGGINNLASLTP